MDEVRHLSAVGERLRLEVGRSTRARSAFSGPSQLALLAMFSDRALKVGYFSLKSFDHDGTSDHRAGSRRRTGTSPPLADWITSGIV
jgi:hypothetical protein